MNDVHTLLRWWKRTPPLATADAFAAMYAKTHVRVFRYIYGLHGGRATEAEDLVAQTFLRAWQARHRFQGDDDAALGWLLQIARRLVIDAHRRQQHRNHAPASALDDLPLDDQPLDEQAIRRDNSKCCIGSLPIYPLSNAKCWCCATWSAGGCRRSQHILICRTTMYRQRPGAHSHACAAIGRTTRRTYERT